MPEKEYTLSEDHAERFEFLRRKKIELDLIVASQTKANHWISREIVYEEAKLWEELHKEHNLELGRSYVVRGNTVTEEKEEGP